MSRLSELIKKLCPDGVEYRKLDELGKFYGGITGKSKDDFKDGNAVFITYKNVYANPALDITPEDRVKISESEKQRTLDMEISFLLDLQKLQMNAAFLLL